MTPFPQGDEEEKWRALLGMDTLSAPALSDPAMQPEAIAPQPMPMQAPAQPQPSLAPDTSHWQALAGQLPDPPTASYDPTADKGGLILAAFADALLNKGRSIPTLIAAGSRPGPDVAEENYKRQRQHVLDQAQVQHLMQQSHGDPEALAIRKAENEARMRQLALQEQQFAQNAANGGITPYQREEIRLREAALNAKPDPNQLTPYQQEALDLRRQQFEQAAAARQDSAATRAEAAADRASHQREQDESKQSREFAKDTLRMRQAAQGAAGVDEVMTRYPEGTDIPGIGLLDGIKPDMVLSDDGMKLRQQQRWMAEAILRGDTGAAAPLSEYQRNAIKVGSSPRATEKEFRVAHGIMADYLQKNIRAFETNREGPARDVLASEGLDEWVNGKPKPPTNTPPPASRETQTATGGGLGVTSGPLPKVSDVLAAPEADQATQKKGVAMKLPNGKLQLPSGAMVDDTPQARARYDVQ